MKKENKEEVMNVSGSFQVVEDERKEDIKKSKAQQLDEESMYYARIFMED